MSAPYRTAVAARTLRPSFALPAAVGAVFFVAGVVQLTRRWPAIGDWAVAELVIRHAARHLPLSGPYSARRGYNHPLPWVYAIQWLPYHLFGSRSSAAPATALWWNGAWAAFVVWLLVRRQAAGLGVVALVALLVVASRVEGVVLLLPWNPNLAVVPAFALLFVAWRIAAGEGSLLPVGVGLAIWCAGAHLGFLPFSTAVVLGAFAVARRRHRGDARAGRAPVVAAPRAGRTRNRGDPGRADAGRHRGARFAQQPGTDRRPGRPGLGEGEGAGIAGGEGRPGRARDPTRMDADRPAVRRVPLPSRGARPAHAGARRDWSGSRRGAAARATS